MRPWTGAEIVRMRQMRRQGYSRAEIAAQLHRTPSAVKAQLGRMEIIAPKAVHVCKCWKCGQRMRRAA